MRRKQILIALVVLAAVVVLYLVLGEPRRASRGAERLVGQLVVPGFVPGDARLIEVVKAGTDPVRVRKQGDAWSVESAWAYPADPLRVEALLQAIEELRVREVRSSRRENRAEFGVDEAGGMRLRVADGDGKALADVWVGRSAGYQGCFVRREGADDVVEASPNLAYDIGASGVEPGPNPTFFVNKKVLDYTPAEVRRITLERESGTVVLEKAEVEEPSVNPETGEEATKSVTNWMIRQPEEEEANENACMAIVNGLAGMMATEIGGGKTAEECGLVPPQAKVTFELSGETGPPLVSVLFGSPAPEENRYYAVRGEEGARVFVVSSYYWDLAVKDLNDLRAVKREVPSEPSEGAGEGRQPPDEPAETPGPQDQPAGD